MTLLRRSVLIVGAVLVAVLLTGVGAVVLFSTDDGTDPPSYTPATRQAFLEACTAEGGEPVEPECRCLYEEITAEIPYERYREISERFRREPAADGGALGLPDDIAPLLAMCRRAAPLPAD